jgi:hypothetical protein
MSVSTEVQRTLVKSPPELWSELSNPEALARHLADLGEIRITSVEPEAKVEWEAEAASGVVHLKQSGWGTKVTLSVTRAAPAGDWSTEPEVIAGPMTIAEPGVIVTKPKPSAEADPVAVEPVVEPEPVAVAPEPEPEPSAKPEPELVDLEPEPELVAEPELESTTERGPEPQPGFFARLFRRRRTRLHETVEPEIAAELELELEVEFVDLAAPEPIYPEPAVEPEPPAAEPASDLAAELASVEAQMAQETTELLTGVLDRLGAAHHRPFSRG